MTRLVKITARAKGHTIFRWSAVVTYCTVSKIGLLYIHSDLESRTFHTAPVFEALLRMTPSNLVTTISCLKTIIMRLSGNEIIATISIYV